MTTVRIFLPSSSLLSSSSALFAGYPPLFMLRLLSAPLTKLFELYLPLHRFLVLARVIIAPVAHGAFEADQSVGVFNLCHARFCSSEARLQNLAPRQRRGSTILFHVMR